MRPQSIILAAVLLLAACGTTATPTPDIRAGLLADIGAYQARFGQCVIPDTAPASMAGESRSFLLGRPELNRYVAWVWPRRSLVGLCDTALRNEANLREYLAQR